MKTIDYKTISNDKSPVVYDRTKKEFRTKKGKVVSLGRVITDDEFKELCKKHICLFVTNYDDLVKKLNELV